MNKRVSIIVIALGTQSLQSSIVFLTLAWYFTNITNSPLVFGSLMAFRYIPGILLTTLSGIAIGRMKKIPLGLWSSIWHLFSLLLLLVVGWLKIDPSGANYWIYAGVVIFIGISSAVLTPLERTLVPILCNPGELKSVNSVITVVTQVSNLLGTSAAGILLLTGGFTLSMVTAVILSFLSVLCYIFLLVKVKIPHTSTQNNSVMTAFKTTVRDLKEQKWIFIAISSAVFTNMSFVMIMDVLLPTLFSDLKINGSAALGLCFTAIGAGTLIGAALTYKFKHINFNTSIFLYIGSALAAIMGGYFLDSVVFSLVAFGLFGLLAAPITIIFQTTLQEAIPVNILGSAMGVLSSGATVAQPIGVLLGGVLLLKLEGATVLTITCSFSIIAVSIGWWRLRLQQMQSQNSSEHGIQKVNSPSA